MKSIALGLFLFYGIYLYAQKGPSQPTTGPGGNNYSHESFDSAFYGSNLKEWCWIFEPKTPKPDSAPVIIYWHGFYGGSNYRFLGSDMIHYMEHMVKKGYIVIKPVFQYGGSATFSNADGAALINYAFSILNSGTHVRPAVDKDGKINYGMIGYSNGSKFAFNISNDYALNGIPAPKAIFTSNGNPGTSAANLPATTKIALLAGDEDDIVPLANVEAQFNQLTTIPCENKNLFLLRTDKYGSPGLTSDHLFSLTGDGTSYWVNAMDWNAVWKYSVGLMDCAMKDTNCDYVFTNVDKIMDMGMWSDSAPIKKIIIQSPCNPIAVSSISMSPATLTMATGVKKLLSPVISPIEASNKEISWSSNNPSVATIGSNGIVTAITLGTATITATTQDGNKTATCSVTVNAVTPTSISISPTNTTLYTSDTKQLTATILPANATNKDLIWTSSNEQVAIVSATGLVSAIAPGTATISATNVSGSKKGSSTIKVIAPGSAIQSEKLNFVIFPNPLNHANPIINLSGLTGVQELMIYDIQGKLVFNHILNENEVSLTIHLSDITKGLYFVKIINDKYSIVEKILVE